MRHLDEPDPAEHEDEGEREAQRALGDLDRHLASEQHTRDRADQQPPIACRSTLPCDRWPSPATQSNAAAWVISVPTIFGAVSGKTSSIASPKNVPEPTDVSPTTNPPRAPIATATTLSRAEQERRVVRSTRDERLREEAEAAEDQRGADDLLHRRVRALAEPARDLHADERQRREPSSIQSARCPCTVPSIRWRTAPNDLKTAP